MGMGYCLGKEMILPFHYSLCIFSLSLSFTLSLFEKLTNLHMLKSGRLISNACDRNQQVDVCLQIRRYFAIMGSADYQQVTSYLLFIVFKYPPFYRAKPHLLHLKAYVLTRKR